jgi:HD-GYP domain-containing protein (c-di-GMP phosphodiesterase class II)
VLGSERSALWIEEDAVAGDLVARATHGYEAGEIPGIDGRLPGALAGAWRARTTPFVLEPQEIAELDGVDPSRIARLMVAPLRLEGNRVAALTSVICDREIDDRELRLLAGLAHQAKLAIETAEHYESLERTFVSTVASLANALEANDAYTSSHARWITDMSLLVGNELRLDRDALKRLELAALFHDIGKIGIPSEILQKAGPLTPEEFEIVKQHPELGEKILAPIDRLADVRPIVRACHERWDGQGYPDGTAGTDIPVEARIVLVCDAFHAIVTDRPYRAQLPAAEAMRRLRESSGSQFDPAVVDAFVALFEAGKVTI